MLALDSLRWATLRASPGGSGELAARLLQDIRAGTGRDFGELSQQCCHQLAVGEVAYAAVPHVIDIAVSLPARERVAPLVIAGTVAACLAAFPRQAPSIPDDLADDYQGAARPALTMASEALGRSGWRPGEIVELLGVVAAFQGHCDLAIHLLLHGGSDHDLSCPMCGEYIRWRDVADA